MKYIITLATICITPCLMLAMDNPEYAIPQGITIHKKPMQRLYISTYLMLKNFKPNDQQTRKNLIETINNMNNLKLAQPPVTEKEIGFYFYKEKNKSSFTDSLVNSLFETTDSALTRSIFFARLAQYNDDLAANCLTSPNKQQVANYFKKRAIDELVLKNARQNIIIAQQIIDETTIPAPASVGVEEFAILLTDIQALLTEYTPKQIRQTAKLIYHNELTRNSTQS